MGTVIFAVSLVALLCLALGYWVRGAVCPVREPQAAALHGSTGVVNYSGDSLGTTPSATSTS